MWWAVLENKSQRAAGNLPLGCTSPLELIKPRGVDHSKSVKTSGIVSPSRHRPAASVKATMPKELPPAPFPGPHSVVYSPNSVLLIREEGMRSIVVPRRRVARRIVSGKSRVLDEGYSASVRERREELARECHQSLVPQITKPEREMEQLVDRLGTTKRNLKKPPQQDCIDCMLGAGLLEDMDLFRELMNHFVQGVCKADDSITVDELVFQGPVLWLLGDLSELSAAAVDGLDRVVRQLCGTAVPFQAIRRPLLLKPHQGGPNLPTKSKVFAISLKTNDEGILGKLAKLFESGKIASMGDFLVLDFRIHLQLVVTGHPDLVCRLKTASRRGLLDELLNIRQVAESMDALRQSYACTMRVLADVAMGHGWDPRAFLPSLPLDLLQKVAQRLGLQLLSEFDSQPGVDYETTSRKLSLLDVADRMQQGRTPSKRRSVKGHSARPRKGNSSPPIVSPKAPVTSPTDSPNKVALSPPTSPELDCTSHNPEETAPTMEDSLHKAASDQSQEDASDKYSSDAESESSHKSSPSPSSSDAESDTDSDD
eukprot:GGOE01044208.1.p1 GENE.GGOE01044208.1~~GGOE01044208.1.p1  ORF type:complete len:540 (+),score=111.37 GGOE01044208.1:61-1680(+)